MKPGLVPDSESGGRKTSLPKLPPFQSKKTPPKRIRLSLRSCRPHSVFLFFVNTAPGRMQAHGRFFSKKHVVMVWEKSNRRYTDRWNKVIGEGLPTKPERPFREVQQGGR